MKQRRDFYHIKINEAASEWGEDLYIDSENDIYDKIERYIVIGADDGAYIHE